MPTLNSAVNRMTSGSHLQSVVLVAAGLMFGQMGTRFLRNNVVDLNVRGADAVYAAVLSVLVLAYLPREFGTPLSLGLGASAAMTLGQELGVVS